MREDTLVSKAWYNVKSAGQTLSLSADVLDNQPEGVYRRSHCWLIANQWLADAGLLPQDPQTPIEDDFEPQFPPTEYSPIQTSAQHAMGTQSPVNYSPAQSPLLRPMTPTSGLPYEPVRSPMGKSSSYTNLQQVDLKPVAAPAKAPRPASQYNPSITFDSILAGAAQQTPEKKKKR